jgi:phosphatidylglycerol:prolipoprotein diacylglycerol transferase
MVGFGAGYLILRALVRRGFLRLSLDAVGDLIFALVLGVILGGRIGYVLVYDFAEFARHPLKILEIWGGGLSFHGGMVGAILAGAWFARKHHVSWLNVGDGLALGVGPGIFAVRCANFVNGELFGRVASPSVPWAMRFPTDPAAEPLLGVRPGMGLRERELVVDQAYRSGLWKQVEPRVPLRHPSQLYEALGEGLLVGLLVWSVWLWNRRRGVRWGDGAYGGIFLIGYGAVRTFLELFRQPDAQFASATNPLGTVLGPLSMGQVLSILTALVGVFFLVRGIRTPPADLAPESVDAPASVDASKDDDAGEDGGEPPAQRPGDGGTAPQPAE